MFAKYANNLWMDTVRKALSRLSKEAYWNLRAKGFSTEYGGCQAKYDEQHWILKEILEENRPNKILDIGCGFGSNIKFMIEECGFTSY